MIGFNKPYLTGKETEYIKEAVMSGKISGDGIFTKKCHQFFEQKYGFRKALLTTSCTDALEMAAILLDIKEGDEIIVPSYTFVSTVNAFMLRGAKIVFVDSGKDNPNIDVELIEKLITPNTKAIVPVHYAGIACNMDKIMALANKYHLFVVEDAAQAIDSFYKGKPLGSIGHLAAFSFHETKNIISGEGGMLVINDERFVERAEIIREKGTNRSAFFRGEIDKYGWVDIGSSFLPSDIIAAFLYAQIENLDDIQNKRKHIWNTYYNSLRHLEEAGRIKLPSIPDYATNNAHMFYIICSNVHERSDLIKYLKENDINVVFHYLSLHKSPFYIDKHDGREMPVSDELTDCLVRLPFYYELTQEQQKIIIRKIKEYYYDKN
ncbi:dTDP-4-amino-4,6-dideoxygalactose transaminase [uncultured Chryseobacterium sp.]|uniref:dTDP-4-amino-4,6-dideoxygalactose transaminase n=1 Tax=uncultured Chryseobacterium sp. TaxID=259322 RepID=UPI00374981DC